jgi:F420-non-reducing hydrogenase small subunit
MMSDTKVKLACYWACSCGGCDVAVLDTDLKILELAEVADIVFWPIVVDIKEADIEAMPDGYIDLCLFNGSIRDETNKDMAMLLRRKSKVLIAFGTCAYTGGIHGLINVTDTDTIKETVYAGLPSMDNPERSMPLSSTTVPEGELSLPRLFDTVRSLDQVVNVDYYVPGCPPAVERISEVLDTYLGGNLPEKGAVLGAYDKALCDTCPRVRTDKKVNKFTRSHLTEYNDVDCFLEQGIICLGPVTRSGCGEQCIRGNMPCRGCYGPTPRTVDPGGAMIGVLASLIESSEPDAVRIAADSIDDPLGILYVFTMATSLLRKVR